MKPETLVGRCPEGMEFVSGYRKKNGEYVQGFCRRRHERITAHDRSVDHRNVEIARKELQEKEQPTIKQEIKEDKKEPKEAEKESIEPTIRAAEEKRE